MSAPVWSKIDTHCVVCARPFAREPELDRHAEKECEDRCWCLDFCWVEYGGDCTPSEDMCDEHGSWEDDLRLYALVRAWRELAESRAAAPQVQETDG
jgi:hypothetical protein